MVAYCRKIGCPQCRVWFDSTDVRKEHTKSLQHALVVWELKNKHVREGE